tara:strand:- start:235 stop:684 length:450 start_codon:yes stop_codon:yes gene_type:complete
MKILVCADGESHSTIAIKKAVSMGLSLTAEVTALHVIDPWLKTFHDEIYAQGRRQYLEYVEECLEVNAEEAKRAFYLECIAEGFNANFKVRRGEPLVEILDEVSETVPDLLITGGKRLTLWGRFGSGNLPLQLQKKIGQALPIIVVKGI